MKVPHPFLCDYITVKRNQQILHLLLALVRVGIGIKQKCRLDFIEKYLNCCALRLPCLRRLAPHLLLLISFGFLTFSSKSAGSPDIDLTCV